MQAISDYATTATLVTLAIRYDCDTADWYNV